MSNTHPTTRPRNSLVKVPGSKSICKSGVSLMSFPSKMDCPGWGMTALDACPMAAVKSRLGALAELQLGKEEVERLTCNRCYATRGLYTTPSARQAYATRFLWARQSMQTEAGRAQFVAVMVAAIRRECQRMGVSKFRIHDSGDFFSPAYIRCWIEICRQCAEIIFWAPTRSYRAAWMLPLLVELNALPNTSISPSGLLDDGEIPVIPGLNGGSVVLTGRDGYTRPGAHTCTARTRGGHCGGCLVCYHDYPRIYPQH
jgi:Gene product 88